LDSKPPGAGGDLDLQLSPVDRLIARGSVVGVGEYVCAVEHPQFAGGGPETCPYVVFSRSSVRLRPNRGAEEVCSPTVVNLLDIGDSYERSALSPDGVHCDWIAISPTTLRDIVREFAPHVADDSSSVFARPIAPLSAATFLAQRQFFDAAHAGRLEALALEEGALRVVGAVLQETVGLAGAPKPRPRRNGARQFELVDAVKRRLARDFCSDLSIVDLARSVHCSPAYLSRTFTRIAGCTLHEYRQQLRLRAALDLLGDGRFNAAAIAIQLGFSSHSHFTWAFRRAFGITPSEFVRGGKR
jgi:AraC-like DNA-binding protein